MLMRIQKLWTSSVFFDSLPATFLAWRVLMTGHKGHYNNTSFEEAKVQRCVTLNPTIYS
jgi:hypothetical protein